MLVKKNISINVVIQDSAAYIQGWLWALKNDKRLVVEAASPERLFRIVYLYRYRYGTDG